MASRGGQPGNTNPTKARDWTDAIHRALTQREGSRAETLRKIADRLIDEALTGDVKGEAYRFAVKEIGDRTEGKAKAMVEFSQDPDNPLIPPTLNVSFPQLPGPDEGK